MGEHSSTVIKKFNSLLCIWGNDKNGKMTSRSFESFDSDAIGQVSLIVAKSSLHVFGTAQLFVVIDQLAHGTFYAVLTPPPWARLVLKFQDRRKFGFLTVHRSYRMIHRTSYDLLSHTQVKLRWRLNKSLVEVCQIAMNYPI